MFAYTFNSLSNLLFYVILILLHDLAFAERFKLGKWHATSTVSSTELLALAVWDTASKGRTTKNIIGMGKLDFLHTGKSMCSI